jgi:hypothetical protein
VVRVDVLDERAARVHDELGQPGAGAAVGALLPRLLRDAEEVADAVCVGDHEAVEEPRDPQLVSRPFDPVLAAAGLMR